VLLELAQIKQVIPRPGVPAPVLQPPPVDTFVHLWENSSSEPTSLSMRPILSVILIRVEVSEVCVSSIQFNELHTPIQE